MTLPPLYLITDAERAGTARVVDVVLAAVAGGLRWVLAREPGAKVDALGDLVDRISEGARDVEISIAVRPGAQWGARLDLARDRELCGAHVGGGEPDRVGDARDALGPDLRIGYSAHTVDDAARAFACGADYVSLSPVFPPRSKRSSLPPLGVDGFRDACRQLALRDPTGPVYALGGIDADAAGDVARAGALGVAVIGALLDADDPRAVASRLLAPFA